MTTLGALILAGAAVGYLLIWVPAIMGFRYRDILKSRANRQRAMKEYDRNKAIRQAVEREQRRRERDERRAA